jgi:hypothetical protein
MAAIWLSQARHLTDSDGDDPQGTLVYKTRDTYWTVPMLWRLLDLNCGGDNKEIRFSRSEA